MPRGVPWEPAEEQRLAELVEMGLSAKQIADVTGWSQSQVESKVRRLNMRTKGGVAPAVLTRIVSETPEATVYAPEETDDEPIGDILARAIRQTARDVGKARAQRFGFAKLVTTKPVGIAFLSDQHLTMKGATDVGKAFEDASAIQQEPGLFCVLGGDGVDNHIKHRSAIVAKSSSPAEEWRLYEHYLGVLGHKVLAVISGNHDDWTRDEAGVDMVKRLAARHRLYYCPDEVVLTIRLQASPGDEGGQDYTAKVRHQYKFNSQLNVGHTVKRMYDMGGDPFDIGVVCHNHEPHMETFERHGLTRYAFRPGSYQIQTGYGRRFGYNPTTPTCPMAVLFPDERRIVPFRDLREGIEHLRAVRADWPEPTAALRVA